uniref:Uncharacterized protein n=1 Tax=Tetranychus urticae TaxID=32264 RepID=T1L1K7_TETUR
MLTAAKSCSNSVDLGEDGSSISRLIRRRKYFGTDFPDVTLSTSTNQSSDKIDTQLNNLTLLSSSSSPSSLPSSPSSSSPSTSSSSSFRFNACPNFSTQIDETFLSGSCVTDNFLSCSNSASDGDNKSQQIVSNIFKLPTVPLLIHNHTFTGKSWMQSRSPYVSKKFSSFTVQELLS